MPDLIPDGFWQINTSHLWNLNLFEWLILSIVFDLVRRFKKWAARKLSDWQVKRTIRGARI